MGDEMDKGDEKVKSYAAEIKKLTLANRELEQQGLKNSQQFEDNVAKIKKLRDAQEEMQRSTLKLDDALSNIPGPIGQIGSSMQQLESITGSAKSAFKSLGLGFDSFDKILKTSLIGFLVGLLATLIAAVMDAAESFQPLKDAFAKMSDAVGAFFNALKPVTDFILNVFVGAINVVADVLNGLASLFGGVNKGFNQMTLDLEKTIKKQETLLSDYGSFLSKNYTELLNFELNYNKKRKELADKAAAGDAAAAKELVVIQRNHRYELRDLKNAQGKEFRDIDNKLINESRLATINGFKNERDAVRANEKEVENDRIRQAQSEAKFYNGRIITKNILIKELTREDAIGNKESIDALNQSIIDEKKLRDYALKQANSGNALSRSELRKQEREWANEDKQTILQRAQETRDLKTSLIKKEVDRNVKEAEDNLEKIKENNKAEIDELERTGATKLGLIEQQAAKIAAAEEQVRKAKLAQTLQAQQDIIDEENRLFSERSQNSMEFYEHEIYIADLEFKKAYDAADGDAKKQRQAKTDNWNKIYQINVDKLNAIADLEQRHAETLQDHTKEYFKAQIDAENDLYGAKVLAAKDNYYLLEILEEEHQKNRRTEFIIKSID
jgi:hypothetical protein